MELLQSLNTSGIWVGKQQRLKLSLHVEPIILRSHYTVPKTNFTVLETIISVKC